MTKPKRPNTGIPIDGAQGMTTENGSKQITFHFLYRYIYLECGLLCFFCFVCLVLAPGVLLISVDCFALIFLWQPHHSLDDRSSDRCQCLAIYNQHSIIIYICSLSNQPNQTNRTIRDQLVKWSVVLVGRDWNARKPVLVLYTIQRRGESQKT